MVALMVLNLGGLRYEQWQRDRLTKAVATFIVQNERLYQAEVHKKDGNGGPLEQIFRQNEANRALIVTLLQLFVGIGSDNSASDKKIDDSCFDDCKDNKCELVKEGAPPYTNWSACLKQCKEHCSN